MSSKEKTMRLDLTYTQFVDLYILAEKYKDTSEFRELFQVLDKKMQALKEHEAYTRWKEGKTEEEREKARLEYLDLKGISENFRW